SCCRVISPPPKVTPEGIGHSVVGKQNPHFEHPSLPSLNVEVHRNAVVVVEPLAKFAHRIGKCPTRQTYFDLAHCWPILRERCCRLSIHKRQRVTNWCQPTRERDRGGAEFPHRSLRAFA